jgi:hypothetical protein
MRKHRDRNDMNYKIIFDNGKPYEVLVLNERELKTELEKFYRMNKLIDNENFDCKVFDYEDNDISETQFISELIQEIIKDE